MSIVCRRSNCKCIDWTNICRKIKTDTEESTNDGQLADAHRVPNTKCIVHRNAQVFLSICATGVQRIRFLLFSVPKSLVPCMFGRAVKVTKQTDAILPLADLAYRTYRQNESCKCFKPGISLFRSCYSATSQTWNMCFSACSTKYMLFKWQTNFQAGYKKCFATLGDISISYEVPLPVFKSAKKIKWKCKLMPSFLFFHSFDDDRSRSVALIRMESEIKEHASIT